MTRPVRWPLAVRRGLVSTAVEAGAGQLGHREGHDAQGLTHCRTQDAGAHTARSTSTRSGKFNAGGWTAQGTAHSLAGGCWGCWWATGPARGRSKRARWRQGSRLALPQGTSPTARCGHTGNPGDGFGMHRGQSEARKAATVREWQPPPRPGSPARLTNQHHQKA